MYYRITAFIDRHDILSEGQHGFRSQRSTETALQDFISEAQPATDKPDWAFSGPYQGL